jgi:hypothetical protein
VAGEGEGGGVGSNSNANPTANANTSAAAAPTILPWNMSDAEGGDAGYLAPESLSRELGLVGQAADCFSLGVLLLEMAADIDVPTRDAGSATLSFFFCFFFSPRNFEFPYNTFTQSFVRLV